MSCLIVFFISSILFYVLTRLSVRHKQYMNETVQVFSVDRIEVTEAFIYNKQVLVKLNRKPAYIYCGWQPFSKGNLQYGDQLPASTFKPKVE